MSADFSNARQGPVVGEDFGIGHVIGFFWAGTVMWALLAYYFDNIIQGEFGTARPYLFFLQSCGIGGGSTSAGGDPAKVRASETAERADDNVGIKISHVVKRWSTPEGVKVAVDDLNLDVAKGAITVLLGHNGAGKTTAMNIMCGMYPPSAGTVLINGHDVTTNIDAARESLGLCPQFDIIWNKLTVKQHL
eukprot:gene28774-17465_t